jgi:predicted GIY-YIG superfamily endonuclease
MRGTGKGGKRGPAKRSEDNWFVYMLRCADGSLYTGIAKDLDRRRQQHNAGTASRYTRSRLPTKLVYREIQASRSLALKREAAIKKLSKREKELMIRPARRG